ncbi:hypothetical protein M0R36_10880 [bacterium]|jgi:hypothetical protein|nr:hypothetical protein [bacterium]
MKDVHHKIQAGIVSWYDAVHGDGMLIAIPNGGPRASVDVRAGDDETAVKASRKRAAITAAIRGKQLEAEGVRAGVLDLFLARPTELRNGIRVCSHRCGLWVEVKRPDQRGEARGGLTVMQDLFAAMARLKGYETNVVYTTEEGISAITKYLGGPTGRR